MQICFDPTRNGPDSLAIIRLCSRRTNRRNSTVSASHYSKHVVSNKTYQLASSDVRNSAERYRYVAAAAAQQQQKQMLQRRRRRGSGSGQLFLYEQPQQRLLGCVPVVTHIKQFLSCALCVSIVHPGCTPVEFRVKARSVDCGHTAWLLEPK